MNLVKQRHWDDHYETQELSPAHTEDPLMVWIAEFIRNGRFPENRSCLEIGCFPGRYLSAFGKAGFELNGIDLTPRVKTDLPQWFDECGFKTGEFSQSDFWEYTSLRKYNVVCSYGFIEHFPNFEQALLRHMEFVEENGYLLVCTPNFRGLVQYVLHKFADNENMARHWIPAMDPQKWAHAVSKQGFEIIKAEYIGTFDFWVEEQTRNVFQKGILRIMEKGNPILQKYAPRGNRYLAPYCGLIARKVSY